MWRIGILVSFLFLTTAGCSNRADRVVWVPLDRALMEQQDNLKPVLFYFYSNTCPYCRLMRWNTFSDPDIADRINRMCIPVRLNIMDRTPGEMPSGNRLATAFRIRAVPAVVLVDSDHQVMDIAVGFMTVRRMQVFLDQNLSDASTDESDATVPLEMTGDQGR